MNERNFFVNTRMGSELLLIAAGEKVLKLYLVTSLIHSFICSLEFMICIFFLFLMVDRGIYHCQLHMGHDESSEN